MKELRDFMSIAFNLSNGWSKSGQPAGTVIPGRESKEKKFILNNAKVNFRIYSIMSGWM